MRDLMYHFLKDLNLESLDVYLDELEELNEQYTLMFSGKIKDSNGMVMAISIPNDDEDKYIYSEEFKTKALEIITQVVKLRIEGWLD